MTFYGYCSAVSIAKYLDIGNQKFLDLGNYQSGNKYTLEIYTPSSKRGYIIGDTIVIYADNVPIDSTKYSVDLNTGLITFSTAPTSTAHLTCEYFLSYYFNIDDLNEYLVLGAYQVERDTQAVYRTLAVEDYAMDANTGYDYLNPKDSSMLTLPFGPILEVTSLTVNGTTVTPSTLKIKGNTLCLTESSEVSEFTGDADSVIISLEYGFPDDEDDLDERQKAILAIVKQANKCASALALMTSPAGRNIFIENSKEVQLSSGEVRAEQVPNNLEARIRIAYNAYINSISSVRIATI